MKCPYCSNEIEENAFACKHCGRTVTGMSQRRESPGFSTAAVEANPQASPTIYCSVCGTANMATARFCFKCGSAILAAVPAPPAAAAVAAPAPTSRSSDFITLSCPNCGGSLAITQDIERFACRYCGYEHIVRRSGGVVSLEPVMQVMGQIHASVNQVSLGMDRIGISAEKQAAEQAIIRLNQEIEDINKQLVQLRSAKESTIGAGIFMIALALVIVGLGFWQWFGEDNTGLGVGLSCFGSFIFVLSTVLLISLSTWKKGPLLKKSLQQKQEELGKKYEIVRRN